MTLTASELRSRQEAQVSRLQERIERLNQDVAYYEQREKMLIEQDRTRARKDRNHRLIVRGLILENHLGETAVGLTDEQVSQLLTNIFSLNAVQEILKECKYRSVSPYCTAK